MSGEDRIDEAIARKEEEKRVREEAEENERQLREAARFRRDDG